MERQRRNRRPAGESCPEYAMCGCPAGHLVEKCRVTNVDRTIEKLRELVSDCATDDQVARISRLLCDYLREIGDEGYVSFDLSCALRIKSPSFGQKFGELHV